LQNERRGKLRTQEALKEALEKRWREALDTHDSEDSSTPVRWIEEALDTHDSEDSSTPVWWIVDRVREIVGVPRSPRPAFAAFGCSAFGCQSVPCVARKLRVAVVGSIIDSQQRRSHS